MPEARVNLFLIGASKCGTTYLHELLSQHPDICMSSVKEPRIFQREDYLEALQEYEKCFAQYAGQSILGEASPVYSETTVYPEIAARIARYNPQAKILYVVRDPIERLKSVWIQAQSTGHDVEDKGYGKKMPSRFIDAVYEYPPFLEACRYWTHIESYRSHFSDSAFKLVLFETLVENSEQTLREICDHLGLEESVHVEVSTSKVNSRSNKKAYNPWPKRIRSVMPDALSKTIPSTLRRAGESKLRQLTDPELKQAELSVEQIREIRHLLGAEVAGVYKYMGLEGDPWNFFS